MNKDFFANNKELIINVSNLKLLNLFFGAEGCRYFTFNDVIIVPHNSKVKITLEQNGNVVFFIETDETVNINQRPTEPYPSFVLNVNENKYVKYQIYLGVLKIEGNCDVIQKPYQLVDS
jgi:hypothetical protein